MLLYTPADYSFFLKNNIQPVIKFGSHLALQSVEADGSTSSIYETVRSELRRAISEIQNDLQSVSFFGSWLLFCKFDGLWLCFKLIN